MLIRSMTNPKSDNKKRYQRFCLSLILSSVFFICARSAFARQPDDAALRPTSGAQAQPTIAAVTLRDCIHIALQRNVDFRIAKEAVEESSALRASALGHFGPKVTVEGNVMRWDEPTNVSFASTPRPFIATS
ncbi:MAG: hypothetical protein JXA30_03895 [Deltaproteobacteria bacterium]|nr:hypothetical protein [Deltaproteobacteria bacterium]